VANPLTCQAAVHAASQHEAANIEARWTCPMAAEAFSLDNTDVIALDHLGAGPLGPVELGDRLVMRSASATALVDRLETAGHVQRQPHPSDRRRLTVVPTTSAIRQVVEALGPLLADLDAAAAELPPDQQQAVARYLERVAHALHSYGQHQQ
jgi:DNA-binding MarR family transcriptional regulator